MTTFSKNSQRESYTNYRTPTRDEIAEKAYDLWLNEGCPEGRALDHWLTAEQALLFPTHVEEQVTTAVPPAEPVPMGSKLATHRARRPSPLQSAPTARKSPPRRNRSTA